MPTFKITYIDHDTQLECIVEEDFTDTPPMGVIPGFNGVAHNGISAWEWAKDRAYMLAGKGWHKVELVSLKG